MFKFIYTDAMRFIPKEQILRQIDVPRLLWIHYGLQALVIYRFGRWLESMRKHHYGWIIADPLYPIYWVLSICVRKAYSINLEQSADISPGLYISHFGGIEVKNCRIGPHCAIYQQVKLGTAETTNKGLVTDIERVDFL